MGRLIADANPVHRPTSRRLCCYRYPVDVCSSISAANIGPNQFHHSRTVSWRISMPRSAADPPRSGTTAGTSHTSTPRGGSLRASCQTHGTGWSILPCRERGSDRLTGRLKFGLTGPARTSSVACVLLIGDSSLHGLVHRSKQGLGGDRLGEVNVSARAPAGLDMFPHRIRCHHDDRNVPAG